MIFRKAELASCASPVFFGGLLSPISLPPLPLGVPVCPWQGRHTWSPCARLINIAKCSGTRQTPQGCAVLTWLCCSCCLCSPREIGSAGNWPPCPAGIALWALLAAPASGTRWFTTVVTAYQGIVVWITAKSQNEQIPA